MARSQQSSVSCCGCFSSTNYEQHPIVSTHYSNAHRPLKEHHLDEIEPLDRVGWYEEYAQSKRYVHNADNDVSE